MVKLSSFGSFAVRSKGARMDRNSEDRKRGADNTAQSDGL